MHAALPITQASLARARACLIFNDAALLKPFDHVYIVAHPQGSLGSRMTTFDVIPSSDLKSRPTLLLGSPKRSTTPSPSSMLDRRLCASLRRRSRGATRSLDHANGQSDRRCSRLYGYPFNVYPSANRRSCKYERLPVVLTSPSPSNRRRSPQEELTTPVRCIEADAPLHI